MAKWLCVVALLGTGCLTPDTESCANGAVCPGGSRCVSAQSDSGEMLNVCVKPEQLGICDSDDGVACMYEQQVGTCHGGACIPDECGNRLRDVPEDCDDGNNASNDKCSADCTSTEACGNEKIDSVTGEQCDEGDAIGHDGCASSCRLESPFWSTYQYVPVRVATPMTFDGVRGHVIAVGGMTPVTYDALSDTRQWTGTRWESLQFPLVPAAVNEQLVAYDAARRNVVLFGGTSGATWTLDAAGWRVVNTNTAPPSRGAFGMTYDSKQQRVVAYGGVHTVGTIEFLGDTWTFDGQNWTEITGPGPEPRYGHAMAFDAKRGVVVMFGGLTGSFAAGQTTNDLWELDGSTWTKRTFSGGPSARVVSAAAWDPVKQRVVVVGGRSDLSSASTYYKDAWEWDGTSWTQMAPVPAGNSDDLAGHTLATDVARNRVVLTGTHGDTYEFDGATWTPRAEPPLASPAGRVNARAVLDPIHREIVVVGGVTNFQGSAYAPDTLIWSGEWLAGPTVNQPAARVHFGLVYDPIRDEIVLFGGSSSSALKLGDTHVYRHRATRTWTPLSPAMSPEPRQDVSMAWDGVRGRVLLFGGFTTTFLNDTWSWDGTTWSKETPATSPPPRIRAPMVWDPIGKRVILHGGISEVGRLLDDTWIWNGMTKTWTEITNQVRPPPRELGALAFDPGRGHVVLVAGDADGAILGDAWELVGDAWQVVPVIVAPAPRLGHALAPAPDGSGVWMFGGLAEYDQPPLDGVVRLHWDAPFVAEETCTDVDTDGDTLVGCDDPDCIHLCAPLCAPREANCTSAIGCGDGVCESDRETCALCPGDCGTCGGP